MKRLALPLLSISLSPSALLLKRALVLVLACLLLFGALAEPAFAVQGEDAPPVEAQTAPEDIQAASEVEPLFSPELDVDTVYIYNADDLFAFLSGSLGDNADEFILMNDIDMGGWGPFWGRGGDVAFTGRFASMAGERFTISNLALRGRDAAAETFGGNDIGFIRTVGDGAVIEHVIFDAITYTDPTSNVDGWAQAQAHIGLVAGRAADGAVAIRNVELRNAAMTIGTTADANIVHTNTCVGGLIGSVEAGTNVTIEDITIDAMIQMFRGTAANNRGGGVLGESAGDLLIRASQVNVNLRRNGQTGNFWHAGGVLGRRIAGDVRIESVTQNGDVEANVYAGGIVGDSAGAGSLTLSKVSTSSDTTITTNAAGRLGGLVGSAVNNTTIADSENHAAVTLTTSAHADVGGLLGFADDGLLITDSHNYGNLVQTGGINNSRMAGIVARTENSVTLTNVQNNGNITRAMDSRVGDGTDGAPDEENNRVSSGILGSANIAAGAELRIENAVNYGNMLDRIKLLAGIAGRLTGNGSIHITNAINYGDLETQERAAGIVGRNEALNLIIDGCINYGRMSAAEGHTSQNLVGGILGSSQTGLSGSSAVADTRNVTIRNSANRGEIVSRSSNGGWSGVGGIAGWIPNRGLVIENSYNIGHVRSVGISTNLGGIIGTVEYGGVTAILRNVYSVGPVTVSTGVNTASGNGILGNHRGGGTLNLENAYVSAFFSGSAISDNIGGVTRSNVYVDRSTARTTDVARLQTGAAGITGLTTEQLTSGSLAGLTGEPWMYGIAGRPNQRTLPYFAWQTGGGQQEPFFHEIYSTNTPSVAGDVNMRLTGILDFALTGTGNIDVQYSVAGFNHEGVRVFNPNNVGAAHHRLGSAIEDRSIAGTTANIPSRNLTTGLISARDVIGFDVSPGHRVTFDLNGGDSDPIPSQSVPHNASATRPEDPTREAHTFEGWHRRIEENGEYTYVLWDFEAGVTEDMTLYAIWAQKPVPTTTLTISKELRGDFGNRIKAFDLTIFFYDSNGNPLPEDTEFTYIGDTIAGFDGTVPADGRLILDSDGSARFQLAHGQAIHIEDVPLGGYVQVVETPDANYLIAFIDSEDASVTVNGNDTTVLPMAADRSFRFINERVAVPPTGIDLGSTGAMLLLSALVCLLALAAFALRVAFRHRKKAH